MPAVPVITTILPPPWFPPGAVRPFPIPSSPLRYWTGAMRRQLLLVKGPQIAVNGTPSHSYGTSLAIWDHTVLGAGWYSIYLSRRDGKLSWPSWLVSAPAGSRTSDLSITSPTPNRCTTETTCEDVSLTLDLFRYLNFRTEEEEEEEDWINQSLTINQSIHALHIGYIHLSVKTQSYIPLCSAIYESSSQRDDKWFALESALLFWCRY